MRAFNHAASNYVGQGAKWYSVYTIGCKLGLTCRMINRKGDIFEVSTLFFLQTQSNKRRGNKVKKCKAATFIVHVFLHAFDV